MRYLQQHIQSITDSYKGDLPLAHFLKQYFRRHPILGSRDRRLISAAVYSWYRIANGMTDTSALPALMADWLANNKILHNPLPQLIADLPAGAFDISKLLTADIQLSDGITKEDWLSSMLTQPDLFIRIRQDKDKLLRLLTEQQIPYTAITDTCLALPNGAKIDALLPADAYVVQDASSQHTGAYFAATKGQHWYDCCSGAGGKSLLLKDLQPGIQLTVTDRRESILHNLLQRFRLYHHAAPEAIVANVADADALASKLAGRHFDSIICDAPCSGSGTWARTPEQLHFFSPQTVQQYAALQSSIAVNAARYLHASGRFYYITCSVFRQENEAVAAHIAAQSGMQLISSQLINGIAYRADSMYIAVLQK